MGPWDVYVHVYVYVNVYVYVYVCVCMYVCMVTSNNADLFHSSSVVVLDRQVGKHTGMRKPKTHFCNSST